MRNFPLIFLFILSTVGSAFAQSDFQLKLVLQDGDSVKLPKKFILKEDYKSEIQIQKALQEFMLRLNGAGYVTASVDSIIQDEHQRSVYLFLGKKYEWAELRQGNMRDDVASQVGFKEKYYSSSSFNYAGVKKLLERILRYNENNGFPFSEVKLDSVQIIENAIYAQLFVERKQQIVYDTLSVIGNEKISRKFLSSYLNVKTGKLYNESAVKLISKRVRELPYLVEEKPPQIIFIGDKAKINLFVKNKRASQFDFLIGILPNNEATGRVLFTGEVNLNLISPFGRGERIYLNWKKLQPKTQSLNVGFEYPYLFSLPFAVHLAFDLYKRDTSYLNIAYDIGLKYLISGGSYLKGFVNNHLTNLLSVDTLLVKTTGALPPVNDVRNTLFGVEYYFEKLDYRLNPRDGYTVKLKAGAGTKKIKENSTITGLIDFDNGGTYASLYDTIKLKTAQYKFDYKFEAYWPIKKRSTVKTSFTGGAFISENTFQNELYRIGGSHLLRGFDEEDILASLFNVLSVELRFILFQNSYVSLFGDAAYVENKSSGKYSNDYPFGFGAGLTFETKIGLFAVSYALGSQQNEAINFKSAKIHFGYVNYF